MLQTNEACVLSTGSQCRYHVSNPENTVVEYVELHIESRTKSLPFDLKKAEYKEDLTNTWTHLASPQAKESKLKIEQDAFISFICLQSQASTSYQLHRSHHGVYFFLIDGICRIDDQKLASKDGLASWNQPESKILALETSKILAIEIPLS